MTCFCEMVTEAGNDWRFPASFLYAKVYRAIPNRLMPMDWCALCCWERSISEYVLDFLEATMKRSEERRVGKEC